MSSSHNDHEAFIKTPQQLITVVVLAFVVPVIGIIMLVSFVLGNKAPDPAALTPEAVAARIQPVGQVEMAGAISATPAAPSGSAPAAAGPIDGAKIYASACATCHGAGVMNAPKFGDKNAWAPRVKTGLAALVKSAVGGKGSMPAKGGNAALSEAEVKAAVEHMVSAVK